MNPSSKNSQGFKLWRVLDANFNRSKEALRVCEDVLRFCFDDGVLTKEFKLLRHDLSKVLGQLQLKVFIKARDIEHDAGKGSTSDELTRNEVADIFYANAQRAKESLRVLEEFMKLNDSKLALKLKSLRYKLYALEKKAITKF